MLAIEGGCWMVTLGGLLGERVPTDSEGYLSFARSLPRPDVYDVIRRATPVGDVARFAFGDSRRLHYERLQRFPGSYLVLGDALCSFNPVYGQGMSVAALEAVALQKCLDEPAGMHDLWPRLRPHLCRVIDNAWQLAVQGDLGYPEVIGPRSWMTTATHHYLESVHKAASTDATVCRTFFDVANLLASPRALAHPRILIRVIRHALCNRR